MLRLDESWRISLLALFDRHVARGANLMCAEWPQLEADEASIAGGDGSGVCHSLSGYIEQAATRVGGIAMAFARDPDRHNIINRRRRYFGVAL